MPTYKLPDGSYHWVSNKISPEEIKSELKAVWSERKLANAPEPPIARSKIDASMGEEFVKGVKSGTAALGEGLLDVASIVSGQDVMPEQKKALQAVQDRNKRSHDIAQPLSETYDREGLKGLAREAFDPDRIARGLGEALPSLGAMVGTSLASGGVATVAGGALKVGSAGMKAIQMFGSLTGAGLFGGALEGADVYHETLLETGNEDEARENFYYSSAANTALNLAGLGPITKMLPTSSKRGIAELVRELAKKSEPSATEFIANRAKQFGKAGIAEAVTEYLEEPVNRAIMAGNSGIDPKWKEALVNSLEVLAPSGLLGGSAGAVFGGQRPPRIEDILSDPTIGDIPLLKLTDKEVSAMQQAYNLSPEETKNLIPLYERMTSVSALSNAEDPRAFWERTTGGGGAQAFRKVVEGLSDSSLDQTEPVNRLSHLKDTGLYLKSDKVMNTIEKFANKDGLIRPENLRRAFSGVVTDDEIEASGLTEFLSSDKPVRLEDIVGKLANPFVEVVDNVGVGREEYIRIEEETTAFNAPIRQAEDGIMESLANGADYHEAMKKLEELPKTKSSYFPTANYQDYESFWLGKPYRTIQLSSKESLTSKPYQSHNVVGALNSNQPEISWARTSVLPDPQSEGSLIGVIDEVQSDLMQNELRVKKRQDYIDQYMADQDLEDMSMTELKQKAEANVDQLIQSDKQKISTFRQKPLNRLIQDNWIKIAIKRALYEFAKDPRIKSVVLPSGKYMREVRGIGGETGETGGGRFYDQDYRNSLIKIASSYDPKIKEMVGEYKQTDHDQANIKAAMNVYKNDFDDFMLRQGFKFIPHEGYIAEWTHLTYKDEGSGAEVKVPIEYFNTGLLMRSTPFPNIETVEVSESQFNSIFNTITHLGEKAKKRINEHIEATTYNHTQLPLTDTLRQKLLYDGISLFHNDKAGLSAFDRQGNTIKDMDKLRGASRFLFSGFTNADFSSGVHELAHYLALTSGSWLKAVIEKQMLKTKWSKTRTMEQWDRDAHEAFAKGFELYMMKNQVPEFVSKQDQEQWRTIFEFSAKRLQDIYRLSEDVLVHVMPVETRRMWDTIFFTRTTLLEIGLAAQSAVVQGLTAIDEEDRTETSDPLEPSLSQSGPRKKDPTKQLFNKLYKDYVTGKLPSRINSLSPWTFEGVMGKTEIGSLIYNLIENGELPSMTDEMVVKEANKILKERGGAERLKNGNFKGGLPDATEVVALKIAMGAELGAIMKTGGNAKQLRKVTDAWRQQIQSTNSGLGRALRANQITDQYYSMLKGMESLLEILAEIEDISLYQKFVDTDWSDRDQVQAITDEVMSKAKIPSRLKNNWKGAVSTVYINSLLSSPITQTVAVTSNSLYMFYMLGHAPLTTLIDKVVSKARGRRSARTFGLSTQLLKAMMYNTAGVLNPLTENRTRTLIGKALTGNLQGLTESEIRDIESATTKYDAEIKDVGRQLTNLLGPSLGGRSADFLLQFPARLMQATDLYFKSIYEEAEYSRLRGITDSFQTDEARKQWLDQTLLEIVQRPGRYPLELPAPFLRAYEQAKKDVRKAVNKEIKYVKDDEANSLARQALYDKLLTEKKLELQDHFLDEIIDSIAQNRAKYLAEDAVFQGPPGQNLRFFMNWRNTMPLGLGKILFPFIGTIANLVKKGMELTPGLGIPAHVYFDLGKVKHQKTHPLASLHGNPNNIPWYDKVDWADLVAKQIEGSVMLLGIFMMLDKDDPEELQITGALPREQGKRLAMQSLGIQPYSIKVGDTWVDYRRYEPFGTVLGMAAEFYSKLKEYQTDESDPMKADKDRFELSMELVFGVGRSLLEATYFSTPIKTLSTEAGLTRQVVSSASSLVPYSAFWRWMYKGYETVETGQQNLPESKQYLELFGSSIPFRGVLGFDPPLVQLNRFGEPVYRDMGMFFEWLPVSPFLPRLSQEKDDLVEKELQTLGIYPGLPAAQVTLKYRGSSVTLPLDEERHRELLIESGIKAKAKIKDRISQRAWSGLSNDRKITAIDKILRDTTETARRRIIVKYRKEFMGTAKEFHEKQAQAS